MTEIGVALRLMRAGRVFVASLAFAPVFLVWKGGIDALALLGHRRNAWTRTARTPHLNHEIGAANPGDRVQPQTDAGSNARQGETASMREGR
jgi:hypothetical protein